MKQIVLIPCHRRPDFLLACLKLIQRAEGWEDNHYLLSIDRGYDPEVLNVCRNFQADKTIEIRQHTTGGNSFNVIRGYKDALSIAKKQKADLINMIETDIFIARDYFKFHEGVNNSFEDHFFVSACRNQNIPIDKTPTGEPNEVYSHGRYQSLGVSFRKDGIERILKHDKGWHLRDPAGYCMKFFPGSHFGKHCVEQDGLIDRIAEESNLNGLLRSTKIRTQSNLLDMRIIYMLSSMFLPIGRGEE